MALVIDTSIVIACITNEPGQADLISLLQGHTLHAPVSLPFELGNAFSAMFKQRRLTEHQAIQAFDLYLQMTIELQEIDLPSAIRLSHQLHIYAYDAYVLQCVVQYNAPLLTLDAGLATSARNMKLPIHEIQR
jgi:predicted nucleic acid-binding protein